MLNDEKFDQSIIGKIKEKHLEPKPRWHFLLKNYVIIAVGALSLILGGLSISSIIFFLRDNDWEAYNKASKSLSEYFIYALPYFWIMFLCLFTFLLYYNIKHTKKGYRYPLYAILPLNILFSICLGAIFYLAGAGQLIDDVMGERMPFYPKIINRRMEFWTEPGKGRLSGVILEYDEDCISRILDQRRQVWLIDCDKTVFRPMVKIEEGALVRMIGRQTAGNSFTAIEVLPPGPDGRALFNKNKREFMPIPRGGVMLEIGPLPVKE